MATLPDTSQTQSEQELTITLPPHALETLGVAPNSPTHSVIENNPTIVSAMAARDEPFPCFKRSGWASRVVIKIVQQRDALGAAQKI